MENLEENEITEEIAEKFPMPTTIKHGWAQVILVIGAMVFTWGITYGTIGEHGRAIIKTNDKVGVCVSDIHALETAVLRSNYTSEAILKELVNLRVGQDKALENDRAFEKALNTQNTAIQLIQKDIQTFEVVE